MEKHKRLTWLDVSRVLCMLLIVSMHFRPEQIRYVAVHSFCHAGVPFYLFWAGYFCAGNYTYKKIIKRCGMLTAVFIVWEVIALIMGWANDANTSFHGIGQFFVMQIGFEKNYPYIGPLWFLRDLIFLTLLTPLIMKGRPVLIPVLLAFVCYEQLNWTHEPETFLSIGTCMIYAIGCWCRPFNITQKLESISTKNLLLFLIICGTITEIIVAKNAFINGNSWLLQEWSETIPGYLVGCFMISACGLLIMRVLPTTGIYISKCAPAMLFVLALHCPLGNEIHLSQWFSGIFSYLQAPVLMTICLAIYFVLKRISPKVMPFLSGNQR